MNAIYTACRYRLYPTAEQKEWFSKNFGCCRKMWNLMLADKVKSYKETKKFGKQTPAMYKNDYPFLKEVDSLALTNVQIDLEGAMRMHFKEKTVGFPKFKSKHRSRRSYTTNNQNGTVTVTRNSIKLPKIGFIKARIHRTYEDMRIKSATVSQESDGKYYASVLFEYDSGVSVKSITSPNEAIGLDMSERRFYVDNNGNSPLLPDMSVSDNDLKRLQRRLSHMIESHIVDYKIIKGNKVPVYDKPLSECKNIQKLRRKIAKIHQKRANIRKDFQHKESNRITNDYLLICIEDLSVNGLLLDESEPSAVKRHNINRKTLANGWYKFTQKLIYKAERKGCAVIKVPKDFPSTQTCSHCGHIQPSVSDLSVRKWTCPVCKTHHDRDINAAVNIRNKGMEMLGVCTC